MMLAMLLSATTLWAEELGKQVNRSFNIRPDTKISVTNKFGNVIITKWNRNTLELKVDVKVNTKSESRSRRLLDAISIDIADKIASGSLSIETLVEGNSNNSEFSIDYEISMPDTNPLRLSNSFGNVYMGSYTGPLDADVRFGQFQAEDLNEANLHIEFSNSMCEVETLKKGQLELKYSKMTMDNIGEVVIDCQFSSLKVARADKVRLDGKYGDIEFNTVTSLEGEVLFAGFKIGELVERLILETRHGNGITIDKVSRTIKMIDIEGEFSTVDLGVESGTNTRLDFDLEFGNLKSYGEGINFDKVIKDINKSAYEGYLGSKSASSLIKVKTKHGNIRLEVE